MINKIIKKIINKIKWIANKSFIQYRFRKNYLEYIKTGNIVNGLHNEYLLRFAFIQSKGKNLKWAYEIQVNKTKYKSVKFISDYFPLLNENEVVKAVDGLKKDGFYILPWRMSKDWIESATRQAVELAVESRSAPPDIQQPKSIIPKAPTYWHKGEDVVKIQEFKNLIKDPGLLEIIGRYLGCKPVFDLAAAWWTFPFGSADSKSAQLYHFDLDRIKWLKVFVYLSDVNFNNGPHAFIRGSHNTVGLKVWRDGRYSDEEVFQLYSKSDEIIYTAPAGTVFLEDTLGFHKGFPAIEGHRFVFEYEYSINGFGYPYDIVLD